MTISSFTFASLAAIAFSGDAHAIERPDEYEAVLNASPLTGETRIA